MTVSSVAFTMYPVSDLARAVGFYTDVVGLTKLPLEAAYWAEFDVGGSTFGIGSFEQAGTPGTAASLVLEVPDMMAARSELHGRNVETTEPFETPVCFISSLRDPDGNHVWLHQAKAT